MELGCEAGSGSVANMQQRPQPPQPAQHCNTATLQRTTTAALRTRPGCSNVVTPSLPPSCATGSVLNGLLPPHM